ELLQRAGVRSERVGGDRAGLCAQRGIEEALVGAHAHGDNDVPRVEGLAGLERADGLQRVQADVPVLDVRNEDEGCRAAAAGEAGLTRVITKPWIGRRRRRRSGPERPEIRGVESSSARGISPMEISGLHVQPTPEVMVDVDRLGQKIAELSAHLEAATARLLD